MAITSPLMNIKSSPIVRQLMHSFVYIAGDRTVAEVDDVSDVDDLPLGSKGVRSVGSM